METRRQDRDILSHQFRGQQRERVPNAPVWSTKPTDIQCYATFK